MGFCSSLHNLSFTYMKTPESAEIWIAQEDHGINSLVKISISNIINILR